MAIQHTIESAQRWKTAVEKLWKTQRSVLIFGVSSSVLVTLAATLVVMGIVLSFDTPVLGTTLIIFSALFGIAGFVFAVIAYVKNWVFYFDLKKWQESSPITLSNNIRTLAICTLITLISVLVAGFFDSFSVIPYVSIVTSAISSLVGFCAFVAEIVKLVTYYKLKGAEDMPTGGKSGAMSIFHSYIVNFVCAFIGMIFISGSIVAFGINAMNDHRTYDIDSEYGYYDDDLDYLDDYDDDMDSRLLTGILGKDFDDLTEEDIEDLYDEITDSEVAVALFIWGFVIILVGTIIKMLLYYRGWWLISKSELEVLPEPTEEPVVEYTPYEEIVEEK